MKKTESDQNIQTPGQLLQSARLQSDISIDTIAQNLRLDISQIQALEEDDYAKFPAIAYVRGYLRGYANQVGMNSEQVIEAFDQSTQSSPSLEPFASQPAQQVGSGDKHMRVVTWSLVGVLILLLGLWWKTHRSSSEIPEPVIDTAVIEDEKQSTPELSMLQGSTGELTLPEIVPPKPILQDEPKELEHEFSVVHFNDLPTMTPQITTPTEVIDQPQVSELAPESSEVSPTSNPVVKPEDGLVLQFTDDSWIQITDSTNKVVFSRIGKAGEVVNVAGTQPFKVVIGKASVVIMSYQGSFIDLNLYAKNEVARFYLDENGAHK